MVYYYQMAMRTAKLGGVQMDGSILNLEYLKEVMDAHMLSEVQLAKAIGVDYTTVYRVFRGDRNPGSKFIAGLVNSGLDIDLEKIFLIEPLPGGNGERGKVNATS